MSWSLEVTVIYRQEKCLAVFLNKWANRFFIPHSIHYRSVQAFGLRIK